MWMKCSRVKLSKRKIKLKCIYPLKKFGVYVCVFLYISFID